MMIAILAMSGRTWFAFRYVGHIAAHYRMSIKSRNIVFSITMSFFHFLFMHLEPTIEEFEPCSIDVLAPNIVT